MREVSGNKLFKFKNKVIQVLKQAKNEKIDLNKGNTMHSESKKNHIKTYNDFKNLPSVLNNNIKMFINRIKRWGF